MNAGISMETGHPATQAGFLALQTPAGFQLGKLGVVAKRDSSKFLARTFGSCSGMAVGESGFSFSFRSARSSALSSHAGSPRVQEYLGSLLLLIQVSLWRFTSSAKFTSWPSNSGPSTHTNRVLPPTLTRQAPHIPVASTMMGFRLTTVLMFRLRVTLQTTRIMGTGPMATTKWKRVPLVVTSCNTSLTNPWYP